MTRRIKTATFAVVVVGSLLVAGGCHSPSKANIELRKQNQQLQSQIQGLDLRHQADQATIRGLQSMATTVPVLPEDELNQLVTTCGLRIGRLTGGDHPNTDSGPDTMLRVYVVPIDGQGDDVKQAGSFRVELFDLALKSDNRIGQWDFDLAATKADWYSSLLYCYVLDCPWQTIPKHNKLMAHITFNDAMTHRIFTVDREVKVNPPGR
jgi:outer membrane murein-binding lipoprotein Lpp